MITARIYAKDVIKMLKNSVEYSQAFTTELNKNKAILNQKLGEESIDAFYYYLDGLARSHPGMLHHVYEWGQIGDPFGRLYELKLIVNNSAAVINAGFLQSEIVNPKNPKSDKRSKSKPEPFYNKSAMMEDGAEIIINPVDAEALFFEIDGEEFFNYGPIVIANPGGAKVRGSFVKAFNEFYGKHFTEVHLRSIKFYKHFSNPKVYEKYFSSAVKSGGANSKGKKAALSWIMNAPGGNYGNL
jgi:hypothetical protein